MSSVVVSDGDVRHSFLSYLLVFSAQRQAQILGDDGMSLVFGQLLHLSRSLVGATATPSLRVTVAAPARLFHASAPMFGNHTKRKNFTILREPPLGPYKLLAPGVQSKWYEKRKGKKNRIGPSGNYRYRVKYPEDGEYTIKKLEIQKLGGRDPVTGRKVIQSMFNSSTLY